MSYEYKVVPAPTRGLKAKGVKSAEDRFAHALETQMNSLATDGWDYLRTDTLPAEQREGLMGKTTVYQNVMVFRRAVDTEQDTAREPILSKPVPPVVSEKPDEPPMAEKKIVVSPPKPLSATKTPSPTDLAAE